MAVPGCFAGDGEVLFAALGKSGVGGVATRDRPDRGVFALLVGNFPAINGESAGAAGIHCGERKLHGSVSRLFARLLVWRNSKRYAGRGKRKTNKMLA
jgi:hypothetical protein